MSNIPELLRRHSLLGKGVSKPINWGQPVYYPNMWMIQTRNIVVPADIDNTSGQNHNIRLFNRLQYKTIILDGVRYEINSQNDEFDTFKLKAITVGEVRTELYFKTPGVHTVYFDFVKPDSNGVGRISNRSIKILRTPLVFTNNTKISSSIRTTDASTLKIEFQSLIDDVNNIPFTIDTVFKCSAFKVPTGARIVYSNSAKFTNIPDSIIQEFSFTPIYETDINNEEESN